MHVAELPRPFFARSALEVAPELLNKVLVADGEVAGRIIEVEAYEGTDDPASHGFNGRTERNAVMFGEPGHLYVYFIYGMHWCANVVCGEDGVCSAVLIRGLLPVRGLDLMRERRGIHHPDGALCDGPAKLCQALAIDTTDDGADICGGRIRIVDDEIAAPPRPLTTQRIGISNATEKPWRFLADTTVINS